MSLNNPFRKKSIRMLPIIMLSLAGLKLSLPADTHTWTGATSANWPVNTNWSEGTAPAPGESNVALIFPLGAANLVNTNDIVGLAVDTISITTAAASPIYAIGGNGITLSSSLAFSNPSSGGYYPFWQIPLTLGGSVTIASSGRASKIMESINLNGQALAFDCTGDITVEGVISGSGSITKNMSSALSLIAANTYSGPTSAYGGSIYIHNGSALGDSGSGTTFFSSSSLGLNQGPFTSSEPITFAGGSQVYAYGQNTLAGMITLNSDVTFYVGSGSHRLTISGAISGTSGISKTDAGTLVLSGTGTYLGTTTIYAGDLSVTGSITSNVVIDGASARLTGGGTVGAISFGSSGGAVYPSVDGIPATLNSNGGFTGTADGSFVVGMDATQASRLAVNGSVNLGGAALTIDLQGGYSPPMGHVFRIIRNDGTDPTTGTFNGLGEGAMHKVGGLEFAVSYVGDNGNETNITVPLYRHAVGNFDGDSAEEAAVDFGPNGVWIFNGGTWVQLSPDNPESLIAADLQADGDDEIIADMGALGLWVWDGGVWANLSSYNPGSILAGDVDGDGQAEILADLDATGLWLWDGGAWTQISAVNADHMVAGTILGYTNEEVIGDFSSLGLWNYGVSWTQLTSSNADFMAYLDVDGLIGADVLGDFGSLGLWRCDGTTWTALSLEDADSLFGGDLDGDGREEMLADFGSLGLWLYDEGVWTQVSASNPQ